MCFLALLYVGVLRCVYCICVSLCYYERERERELKTQFKWERERERACMCVFAHLHVCACVWMWTCFHKSGIDFLNSLNGGIDVKIHLFFFLSLFFFDSSPDEKLPGEIRPIMQLFQLVSQHILLTFISSFHYTVNNTQSKVTHEL